MICFRGFRKGDDEALYNLILELKSFYPSIEPWAKNQIAKIKNGDAACILVDFDGKIGGCAISGVEDKSVSTAKLKTFYIKQEFRGNCIGPYLLNKVLDFWIEKKYDKIFVTFAEEELEVLLEYFKEYGFLLDGVFPFNYRPQKSEYYMSKLNIFQSIDKSKFKETVLNNLFRLRGYKIVNEKESYFVVQKQIYIKEAYKTAVYINQELSARQEDVLSKIKGLMRDEGCQTGIVISYYPLSTLNERYIKLIDGYDLETIFFPLNLEKENFSGFISTIQKNYADRILYDGNQSLLLSDRPSLRKEKVFYKFPNLPEIRRGQTFLFYESDPTKAIIGEGKVKEVAIDTPANLYKRFQAKGVLRLAEIESYANEAGNVLAISIGKFVKYKNKVPLRIIREIKKGFNPQGSIMVQESELREIRKQGRYPYF